MIERVSALLVLALLFPTSSPADPPNIWGELYDVPNWPDRTGHQRIVTDEAGYITVAGTAFWSDEFDAISVPYVRRYTPEGTFQWHKEIAQCAMGGCFEAVVDDQGYLFLAGSFDVELDLGIGPPIQSAANSVDIFVIKMGPYSNVVWVKTYGSSEGEFGRALALDVEGNPVIAGNFKGSFTIDGVPVTAAGTKHLDYFVASLNSVDGTRRWSRTFGNPSVTGWASWDPRMDVGPTGTTVVTGSLNGTADFGGGPQTSNGIDIFVTTYDDSGDYLWSRTSGAPGNEAAYSVALDDADNIVIGGMGDTNFGGTIADGGAFVARFNSAGTHEWTVAATDGSVQSVHATASGDVYAAGIILSTANFAGEILVSAGQHDIFALALNSAGQPLWGERFGDADVQMGIGIASDLWGNIYLAGSSRGTVDFGTGPLTSPSGQDRIFITKFGAPVPTGASRPPTRLDLAQNVPNPFNPSTRIAFMLPEAAWAQVTVFDTTGRRVRMLVDGARSAGPHSVEWDGRDERGREMASGVYFYQLRAANQTVSRKMVLLK